MVIALDNLPERLQLLERDLAAIRHGLVAHQLAEAIDGQEEGLSHLFLQQQTLALLLLDE